VRRLISIVASLLLLPAVAAAKSGVVLDSTPQGYEVGEPWVVSITVIRHDARVELRPTATPSIRIVKQSTGETHIFAFRRERYGALTARVVFPAAGVWTYSVTGLGSLVANQGWEPVTIVPPQVAKSHQPASATSPDRGGGSSVGWVAGAGAAAFLLFLLLLWRRGGGLQAERPPGPRRQWS
jgi:hypothetical protein